MRLKKRDWRRQPLFFLTKLSDSFERTLLGEKSFPTRLPKNLPACTKRFGGQVKSRDLKVLMGAATQVPLCIKKEQI
jgi:hypothetical protein